MSFLRNVRINLGRWLLGSEYVVLSTKLAAALSEVEHLKSRPVEVQFALHRDTFNKKVVSQLETPMINNSVTKEQVAYLLGIQRALRVVEKELVVG